MRTGPSEAMSSRIAASFAAELAARSAANAVRHIAGLHEFQVRIISPEEAARPRRQLFPDAAPADPTGFFPTLYARTRTLWAAVLGVIGMLIWWALRAQPWIDRTPFVWLIIFCVAGILIGVGAAALPTLHSGDAGLFHEVRAALRAGRWVLVVHPANTAQAESIRSALRVRTDHVISTPPAAAATDATVSGQGS